MAHLSQNPFAVGSCQSDGNFLVLEFLRRDWPAPLDLVRIQHAQSNRHVCWTTLLVIKNPLIQTQAVIGFV